jgi:hypothetical protein
MIRHAVNDGARRYRVVLLKENGDEVSWNRYRSEHAAYCIALMLTRVGLLARVRTADDERSG